MNKKDIQHLVSLSGICSGCVVIALVFSMVNSSLSFIGQELALPLNALQWIMSVFGIINCSLLVTCGRLSDIYGRKKLFLFGLASTLSGMIGAGFSRSAFGLIISMGLAGLGNAILLPVSQAMLLSEFPPKQEGRAIGLWATAIGSALAAGPIFGGVIASILGWQWIFWILVPVILFSFILVGFFSKESRNTRDSQELDLKGMATLAILTAAIVLLLTEHKKLTGIVQASILFGACLLAFVLIRVEKRAKEPILRPDLLQNGPFLAASVACAALVFYIWGLFFLFPFYLQKIGGYSPIASGIVMLAITLPVAFLSSWIGKRLKAGQSGRWITQGFCLLLASTLIQYFFGEATPLVVIVAAAALFGVGYSFIWGPSTTAAVSSQPKERAGLVAGTYVTIQEIGGTLALASAVTVLQEGDSLLAGWRLSQAVLAAAGGIGLASGIYLQRVYKRNPFSLK